MSEHRRVEKKLTETIQEWETTFNAANAVIWLLDKNCLTLRTNRKAQQLFQLSEEEIVGKHCWEIVHGTKEPIPECPIFQAIDSMQRESTEFQINAKWFEVTVQTPESERFFEKLITDCFTQYPPRYL